MLKAAYLGKLILCKSQQFFYSSFKLLLDEGEKGACVLQFSKPSTPRQSIQYGGLSEAVIATVHSVCLTHAEHAAHLRCRVMFVIPLDGNQSSGTGPGQADALRYIVGEKYPRSMGTPEWLPFLPHNPRPW